VKADFNFTEFSNKYQEYFTRLFISQPINQPYTLLDVDKRGDGYKKQFNYVILLMRDNEPIDIRIVKTKHTLENFIENKHLKYKLDILFHPNPVMLTQDFWEQYRQSESGAERLKLFKEMNVLADSNMLFIDTIIIDIDTEFSKSIEVLKELVKELKIDINYLHIRKTKSGNLRFTFKVFPMKPEGINKNGKTNLANVKEFVSIINEFFKSYGCKADDSFKRINHPVWITKPEEVWNKKDIEEIKDVEEYLLDKLQEDTYLSFYELYRRAKKLKRKLLAKNKREVGTKKKKVKFLPAFILNRLERVENLTILEKAVRTLAKKVGKGGRYINFLQPVAGWCKNLGLSYDEYYHLVYEYVSDKERDIRIAWKYAREIEFKEYETYKKKYDLVGYAEKVIHYLEKQGATERQKLLREIFENQKWLEQLVMEELCSKDIVKFEFVKAGRGRPKKVYSLDKDIQAKNKEFPYTFNNPKDMCEAVNFEDGGKNYFSQYNNSLFRESVLEEDGIKITKNVKALEFELDIDDSLVEIEGYIEKSFKGKKGFYSESFYSLSEEKLLEENKISFLGGGKEEEFYEYDDEDIELIADLFVNDFKYAIPYEPFKPSEPQAKFSEPQVTSSYPEPIQEQEPVLNDEKEGQERIKKDEELIAEKQKKSDLKSDKDGERIGKASCGNGYHHCTACWGEFPPNPPFLRGKRWKRKDTG